MEVATTLKRIGTSRGFIIPARILKKHHIKENDKVFYEETEDGLAIRFATTVGGTIFDELHEINDMPGEPMSMEEIRKNRRNKEARPAQRYFGSGCLDVAIICYLRI